MKVVIITPAGKRSLSGNRATAARWRRVLRELGHSVDIGTEWGGGRAEMPADIMVALHAWRSAESARAFRAAHPRRPLIVALTGTDLYRFIHSHPEQTIATLERADRLVALHDLAYRAMPRRYRGKLSVIKQSARPIAPRPPRKHTFDICVCGHLREEKDPLRAAYAARLLPPQLSVRILHYGRAHDDHWARAAAAEMRANPAYHWFGEVPHWRVRRAYAECRAMVISSTMEGGANVISEATIAGLPVLASNIDGNIGLLGADYMGYFPCGDEQALAGLISRFATDADFQATLRRQMRALQNGFTAAAERRAWRRLLAGLTA